MHLRNLAVMSLRWMDTFGNLSAIFTKETTLVISCLLSCTPSLFWKGSTLKWKTVPKGSKFVPLSVGLFSEGRPNSFDRVASFESVYNCIYIQFSVVLFNPCFPSGLLPKLFGQFFSNRRGVWLVFMITMFYKCVQRELRSSSSNRGAVRRADALL